MTAPVLLPMPRHLSLQDGTLVASAPIQHHENNQLPPQGYRLVIGTEAIQIESADAQGAYYANQTLAQLKAQYPDALPCLTIDDAPDFLRRGVMLDVSRDRVFTMETLYALIEKLASWKINEIQLYMEHTFAYAQHREVWEHASPFTAEEIQALDAFCRERHIDLVPNQNSLGHMERWLKHPRYNALAEMPDGFPNPWDADGGIRPASTLNPLDPASFELVKDLYAELLPNFSSQYLNVGLDEPWELGKGASKDAWEKEEGRVYLDWIQHLHQEVTAHGKTMQFWADIIVKYPDLVAELPKDAIAMIWGYEADEPREGDIELVSGSGLPFYVVPGTSTWNSLAGRTDNALQNLRQASLLGRKYGAKGFLNTEWGDNGHWQPFSTIYLGLVVGAAWSWCYETNKHGDIPQWLNQFAFEDRANIMGAIAYELGDVYRQLPIHLHNSTVLFHALQLPEEKLKRLIAQYATQPLTAEALHQLANRIESILSPLDSADMAHDDAQNKAEYRHIGKLFQLAIQRLLWVLGAGEKPSSVAVDAVIAEQQRLWLARFREGGLADSLARFAVLGV